MAVPRARRVALWIGGQPRTTASRARRGRPTSDHSRLGTGWTSRIRRAGRRGRAPQRVLRAEPATISQKSTTSRRTSGPTYCERRATRSTAMHALLPTAPRLLVTRGAVLERGRRSCGNATNGRTNLSAPPFAFATSSDVEARRRKQPDSPRGRHSPLVSARRRPVRRPPRQARSRSVTACSRSRSARLRCAGHCAPLSPGVLPSLPGSGRSRVAPQRSPVRLGQRTWASIRPRPQRPTGGGE